MNSWINKSIFYHIYPLGLCGTPLNNDLNLKPVPRLKILEDWIPHLKFLGINAIYIGPLFESTSHGYDTIDYFKIDRRLGTNETFKSLVEKLHKNNIKVIVDGVFNHVGRDFENFKNLVSEKQNSKYISWFSGVNFNGKSPYNDDFSYDSWNGCFNLVKLNTYNPDVKKYIFDIIKFWVNEFDIDGIRLDAADCLDLNFLKELSYYARSIKNDLLLLGEVIHGDYNRWANNDSIDTVTNYECYKGLYSSHNELNYFEIAYSLNRQFGDGGIYKNIPLYNFVDNHDVSRIMSTLKDKDNIYPLYTLLFTMPGVPSIYYGSEFGILGVKQKDTDAPLRPKLNLEDFVNSKESQKLCNFISKLSHIRLSSTALQIGSYKQLFISNKQFVFLREYENEGIIAAVNCSKDTQTISFSVDTNSDSLFNLLNDEQIKIENQKITLTLHGNEAIILKQSTDDR